MNQTRKKKAGGMAQFFADAELKTFFLKYLQLIMVIEILLLFIMGLGFAADSNAAFPTKLYLFLAFGIPLALTLILGLIIQAFEAYIFKRQNSSASIDGNSMHNTRNSAEHPEFPRVENVIYRAPQSLKLSVLLIAAVFIYSLGDIFGFIARTGIQTLDAFRAIAIAFIVAAAFLGVMWMVVHFRIKSRQMENHYRYRKQILDQLGILVLDNDTIIDSKGTTIRISEADRLEALHVNPRNILRSSLSKRIEEKVLEEKV